MVGSILIRVCIYVGILFLLARGGSHHLLINHPTQDIVGQGMLSSHSNQADPIAERSTHPVPARHWPQMHAKRVIRTYTELGDASFFVLALSFEGLIGQGLGSEKGSGRVARQDGFTKSLHSTRLCRRPNEGSG